MASSLFDLFLCFESERERAEGGGEKKESGEKEAKKKKNSRAKEKKNQTHHLKTFSLLALEYEKPSMVPDWRPKSPPRLGPWCGVFCFFLSVIEE